MCVQNDILTIAGEARVQSSTHPSGLPKTLTGPKSGRSGLFQTCRGMRRFTDFCLCTTRAKPAPVSPHLSICRNFTTASTCAGHSVATACHDIASAALCKPVCMYRRGWPADRDHLRHPETRPEKRLRSVEPTCFTGPGAHCTAHRMRSVPKILTQSTRHSVIRTPTNPRHTRDWPPRPPEKPHLIEKSGAATDAKATPEKSHRNRLGIKNLNGVRYLGATGVPRGPVIFPRKISPFRHRSEYDSCVSTPEKPHLCQKVAQKKSDFGQSWRAFHRIPRVTGPEKPHL
ncbi:hypothetical protein BAN20980_00823 [Burkholderia anthina]|uniref:Uncharacterized protein n=1 Tax=Burkholderia anthina TaxID=179879 RepID=A0A6P2G476_9BURK|nr:hypothetical protein BAN20980_00823 [Burkholderia anthina]